MRFCYGRSYLRHCDKNKHNITEKKKKKTVHTLIVKVIGWLEHKRDGYSMLGCTYYGFSQRPGEVTEVHGTSQACVRLQQTHDDRHGSLITTGAAGAWLVHDVTDTNV